MISARFSKDFRCVSLHDPEVLRLDFARVSEYARTRDMAALTEPRTDKATGEPVPALDESAATVFTCSPVKIQWDNLDPKDANDAWLLFAMHVAACSQPFDDSGTAKPLAFVTTNGSKHVDDACRGLVPPEIVRELALVIKQYPDCGGGASPFSLPDGLAERWMRARTYHATRARSDAPATKPRGEG